MFVCIVGREGGGNATKHPMVIRSSVGGWSVWFIQSMEGMNCCSSTQGNNPLICSGVWIGQVLEMVDG